MWINPSSSFTSANKIIQAGMYNGNKSDQKFNHLTTWNGNVELIQTMTTCVSGKNGNSR